MENHTFEKEKFESPLLDDSLPECNWKEDEKVEHSSSEVILLPVKKDESKVSSWMQRANTAVKFRKFAREHIMKRTTWDCTLSFPNEVTEKAFEWYFSKVRGDGMRRGLLWIAFFYMIYSIIEWGDRKFSGLLLAARISYLCILMICFVLSFTAENIFKEYVQGFTAFMICLTGVDIILEGAIQRQIYSPYLIIIMLVFLVSSAVFVRIRFIFTCFVGWMMWFLYNLLCLFVFKNGDNTISSKQVWRWLLWYDAVLVFTIAVLMKMTHRVEVQTRYEFLMNFQVGGYDKQPDETSRLVKGDNISEESTLIEDRASLDYRTFNDSESEAPEHLNERKSLEWNPIESVSTLFRESGQQHFLGFVNSLDRKERLDKQSENHIVKEKHFKLFSYKELPSWYNMYPYVYTGYRVNFSWKLAWKSIFKWHNETVNIWTEFIPAAVYFFGLIFILTFDNVFVNSNNSDHTYIIIGFVGALIIRSLASGLAHLLHCQSQRAYVVWWGIDYISICLCVLSLSLVYGHFTFYCLPEQASFFIISVLGLFFSTIISVVFVSSDAIRAGSFLLFAAFSHGVPFVYQLVQQATGANRYQVPTVYLVCWFLNGLLIGIGLGVKSTCVPERFWPGKFDIWGCSHQWWHFFVTAGNTLCYFGWRSYLEWRHTTPCS